MISIRTGSPALEALGKQMSARIMEQSGFKAITEQMSRQAAETFGYWDVGIRMQQQIIDNSALKALGKSLSTQIVMPGIENLTSQLVGKVSLDLGFSRWGEQLAKDLQPTWIRDFGSLQVIPQSVADLLATYEVDEPDGGSRPLTQTEICAIAWVVWFVISCYVLVVTASIDQPTPFAMSTIISGLAGQVLLNKTKHLT